MTDAALSGSVKVLVKANSSASRLVGFDSCRGAYRVDIKAKAEDNKANIELIRFFSRLTGRKVRILKGMHSREKILKIGSQ